MADIISSDCKDSQENLLLFGSPWGIIVFLAILGIFLRALPALVGGAPVNDGGLFFQMMLDIIASGFSLPETTTYNQASIPFSYPPFGLYLTAIVTHFFNVEPLLAFRVIPFLWSVVALLGFLMLSREILESEVQRIFAFAAYILTFESYQWIVMGGGITRGPGLAFALFSLAVFLRGARLKSNRCLFLSGFCCFLTIVSHPLSAMFVCISAILLVVTKWKQLTNFELAFFCCGLFAFLVPVMILVGFGKNIPSIWNAVFTGHFSAGEIFRPFRVFISGFEGAGFLVGLAGFIGILVQLQRFRFLLVIWLAIFLIIPRWSTTLSLIPLSLLSGIGAEALVTFLVRMPRSIAASRLFEYFERFGPTSVVLFSALFIASTFARSYEKTLELAARTVPQCLVELANTVRSETVPAAKVLILADEKVHFNPIAEWFPVWSQRHVLLTSEGLEWSSNKKYYEKMYLRIELLELLHNPWHTLTPVMREIVKRADVIIAPQQVFKHAALQEFESVFSDVRKTSCEDWSVSAVPGVLQSQ